MWLWIFARFIKQGRSIGLIIWNAFRAGWSEWQSQNYGEWETKTQQKAIGARRKSPEMHGPKVVTSRRVFTMHWCFPLHNLHQDTASMFQSLPSAPRILAVAGESICGVADGPSSPLPGGFDSPEHKHLDWERSRDYSILPAGWKLTGHFLSWGQIRIVNRAACPST
jgi:hypothetical protein